MALNMEYIRKIDCYINNLSRRMFKPIAEFGYTGFFTYDRLTLEEALVHEKQILPEGISWGKKWQYGWFFTRITLPASCKGKRIICTTKLGECVVFVNGEVYGAFDKQHEHITLTSCAQGDEVFDIAMEVYAGHDGLEDCLDKIHFNLVIPEEQLTEFPDNVNQKVVHNGKYGVFYDSVYGLWMDIMTLYYLSNQLDENSLRRAQIDKGLKKMCDAVDIELPFEAFLKAVEVGREILKPLLARKNSETTPTMYAIGHSHLDLEWLWTTGETRRKAARTLGNQLQLMKEYKDYKYIQSQPWLLDVVKNEYPKLYQEIKQAVKDGNIIIEGGAWVEMDTNIPAGESMIRQFQFGKRFIAEEFGVESRIFWLPDSFGVSAAMPQILKGCKMDYFVNAKVKWLYNGGDSIPYSVFQWEGIDGSTVLTSILDGGYECSMTPENIITQWSTNFDKEEIPIELILFGYGDGGGGTTRNHLEYIVREKDLEGMPKVIQKSPVEYFEYIESECNVNNTFVGELYYANHRGTYTSQAKTKRGNRKCEFALRDTEMWSALLQKDTRTQVEALWKILLFNQFHDIIPGSSITAVYEHAEKDYEEVLRKANEITGKAMSSVLNKTQDTITLFNSLSWNRQALVELPSDYTSVEGYETQKIGSKVIALLDVPSCGYKSYKLGNESSKDMHVSDRLILENEFLKAEFNQSGEMISLVSKETNMEFLAGHSNIFKMYQDMPTFFDAWDIDSIYEKAELKLSDVAEITCETGKLYSCLTIKKRIHHSEIKQMIILRKGGRYIEFKTEVDWNETHKLLKVDFNTNIHTEELLSEIQFGHVKRPNHKNRQYDADRFEVWQHKWSALQESSRGMAILNDCKYGISADGGRMCLTLLKSAAEPALNADKGKHQFTYAIMPFDGNFYDSSVIENAYELNCPVIVKTGYAGEKSLLNISNRNVVIETVKLAEDGSDDIIVRLYESRGGYAKAELNVNFAAKEVYITNMLEENYQKIESCDNSILVELKAFEVLTLRLKREMS